MGSCGTTLAGVMVGVGGPSWGFIFLLHSVYFLYVFVCCVSVTFLIPATKMPGQSSLRREGFILASSLGM